MMYKKLSLSFLVVLIVSLLFSCSSKKSNSSKLEENVTTFVSNTDQIVGFGYVDVDAIKNKSQISEIPELKDVLKKTLGSIEKAVKLKDKVYFAFVGPVKDNGPEVNYVFLNIKNKDSLQSLLETTGFSFEKNKDNPNIKIFNDENTAIGFNDNTLVLVDANSNNNPKKLLLLAFDSFNKAKKDKNVAAVLKSKNDIFLAINLENSYTNTRYFMKDQPEERQSEIKKLFKNGYWTLSVNFNKGNLIAKVDISKVNDQLKELYLLQNKGSEEIKRNLGPDSANFALALSLNMDNVESLLNRFGDKKQQGLFQFLNVPAVVKGLIAGESLSGITNGNIGVMMSKKMNKEAFGEMGLYNTHFFLGLGKDSQNIIDLIDTLAGADRIHDLGEGYYRINSGILRLDKNNLVYHINDSLKKDFKTGPIEKGNGLEHFGEQPLSVYMNLRDDVKTYMLPKLPKSIRHLLDYATLQGDNNGFVLKITMKNTTENVLKQLVGASKKELIDRVGNAPVYN